MRERYTYTARLLVAADIVQSCGRRRTVRLHPVIQNRKRTDGSLCVHPGSVVCPCKHIMSGSEKIHRCKPMHGLNQYILKARMVEICRGGLGAVVDC